MSRFAKYRVPLFWSLLAVFMIPVSLKQIADVDIWWHLSLGRAYMERLGPPDVAAFYFSPVNDNIQDLRYIWLGDAIFYTVHAVAGDAGLQLLALAFTALSCALLASMRKRPLSAWTLLALLLLTAGVYQLQTVRNALFSLPLFTLTLWLWRQARFEGRTGLYWLFPPMLAVWSCLHGSYLLGFGVLGLLILGDLLDTLRGRNDESGSLLGQHFLVGGLSLLAVSIYNPLTWQTLSRLSGGLFWAFLATAALGVGAVVALVHFKGGKWFLDRRVWLFRVALALLTIGFAAAAYRFVAPYFTEEISRATIDLRDPDRLMEMERPGFFGKIKLALNNTFWKPDEHQIASSDFFSPLDAIGEIYVWTSLLLGGLCLVMLVFARPFRFSLALPFLAMVTLGLGYKRTVGYLAIISAYGLFTLGWQRVSDILAKREAWAWTASLAAVAAIYAALIFRFDIGLWDNHRAGFGRAPYYSQEISDQLLANHGDEPVFTTITTGGFLLYRWSPHKKVFFDGFFAPHRGQTLQDYRQTLMSQDPELLYRKYGIELAAMALHDSKWISLFSRSEHWYPRYMDTGMVVFRRQPDFDRAPPPLELLMTAEDLSRLPLYYRGVAANRLFETPTSYIVKGRNVAARRFMEERADLLRQAGAFVPQSVQDRLSENLSVAAARYGDQDSKTLRYDFLYSDAAEQFKNEYLIRYGKLILADDPDRFDVRLSLARALLNEERQAEAEAQLTELQRARRAVPDFWKRERETVSKLWLRAAQAPGYRDSPLERYRCWRAAHEAAPQFFSEPQLRYETRLLYEQLLNSKKFGVGLDLLERLKEDYPDNAEAYFYLSLLLTQERERLNGNLETALQYALKAIELMEKTNDPNLDIIYFNAATILSLGGDVQRANAFVDKARETAPPERRDRYRNSF